MFRDAKGSVEGHTPSKGKIGGCNKHLSAFKVHVFPKCPLNRVNSRQKSSPSLISKKRDPQEIIFVRKEKLLFLILNNKWSL